MNTAQAEIEPLQRTSSSRQFIHHLLPKYCQCCCLRQNRRERIMAKCRAQYYREIDIVDHIK